MLTNIVVDSRTVPFRLDFRHSRWHSLDDLKEDDFPLIADVEGKRYELYSDGGIAEAELDPSFEGDDD